MKRVKIKLLLLLVLAIFISSISGGLILADIEEGETPSSFVSYVTTK